MDAPTGSPIRSERSDRRDGWSFAALPPKARRVVQIFCSGGVSHIDTFDYKPDLPFHGRSLENKGENKGFFGQPDW